MHRTSANFAVGLNWPVSIELMVFLDTPTISASCVWESPFRRAPPGGCFLISTRRSFLNLHEPQDKKDKKQKTHDGVQNGKKQVGRFL